MGEPLPSVMAVLEAALKEMSLKRKQLRSDCDCGLHLLTPHRSRHRLFKFRPRFNTPIAQPENPTNGKAKNRNSLISNDNYEFEIRSGDTIYCFDNIDHLMKRLVTPEQLWKEEERDGDLKKAESRLSSALKIYRMPPLMLDNIRMVNNYVKYRGNNKEPASLKRFMYKFNKRTERGLETFSVFEDDLGNSIRNLILILKNVKPNEDHLKILQNKYKQKTREADNELTERFQQIQASITKAVVEDLQRANIPAHILPSVYKTARALSDIENMRIPVLLKTK